MLDLVTITEQHVGSPTASGAASTAPPEKLTVGNSPEPAPTTAIIPQAATSAAGPQVPRAAPSAHVDAPPVVLSEQDIERMRAENIPRFEAISLRLVEDQRLSQEQQKLSQELDESTRPASVPSSPDVLCATASLSII